MENDKSPQLITPESVKAIISRIQTAQLTRTQENISSELSNILDNVNNVISHFQKELGYDLSEKAEYHQMVEKGKNRFILLEKITSLSTDAKMKEKHLYEILSWLGDWGDSLTYEIRTRKNEEDEESQGKWIEVIEKMLPLSLIATKGGIESLISLCSTLIEGERKRAQVPKYTFWQGWQEQNPQISTFTSQPLSPQQMLQDKHTTCLKVDEVISMLQELLDSTMFSKGEMRAIKYISSVVENLSKAFLLQNEENKRLETKYRCLKTKMVKELRSQRLNFQKSLQTLETKRDALRKQVEMLGGKYHELFQIKHTLEYKLKKAEFASSLEKDSVKILNDSQDSSEKKTLTEGKTVTEKTVMEETQQKQEEEEQSFFPLASSPINTGWDSDSRPSSYQSLPTMTTYPGIADVFSRKTLEPELMSSAESPDNKDTNLKNFLQDVSHKEGPQIQLHYSKQQSPDSSEKEMEENTHMEHGEEELSWQRQKQQWSQEDKMWQQQQRRWTLPEKEPQERLCQWELEEVVMENVSQGEKDQGTPRKESRKDIKRTTSQGKFLKEELPLTGPVSCTQSVYQCRRPQLPRSLRAQSITPRNQRTGSSAEFNQKPWAHQIPTKPRKSASFSASELSLSKRTQSPLHISPVPLKEKVYYMDAKGQRENLQLFLGNGNLGLPAALHSKSLELIATTMELSLLKLQCLCLKYIHYRHLESLRQEIINHIQDVQKNRGSNQAQNLSIFLENINILQNQQLQAWTERQKTVEDKYQECLSNMMKTFPKLRQEWNIPLHTPMVTCPKLRKSKTFPSLFQHTSFKQPFMSNSLDGVNLQKAHQQENHLKPIWKTDIASSSYLIEEKIPARLDWQQLGGHPDIPRLLTMDVHSCHHKSSMRFKACTSTIQRKESQDLPRESPNVNRKKFNKFFPGTGRKSQESRTGAGE